MKISKLVDNEGNNKDNGIETHGWDKMHNKTRHGRLPCWPIGRPEFVPER